MIEAHLAEAGTAGTLRYWLSQALGNEAYGEELAAACERLDVGKDEIIAAQGEPARSMHFILEDRLGIIVGIDDGRHPRAEPGS